MSTPYLGEIRIVSFNFAPKGWAFCNGALMPINVNQALFALLGTTYGGDGRTTFALPNLQGRSPIHAGTGFVQGQAGGEAAHVLTQAEMPLHTHPVIASSNPASTADPANGYWAPSGGPAYSPNLTTSLFPAAISVAGGSQPHDNMSPYLVVNFVIALTGIFPSRS